MNSSLNKFIFRQYIKKCDFVKIDTSSVIFYNIIFTEEAKKSNFSSCKFNIQYNIYSTVCLVVFMVTLSPLLFGQKRDVVSVA